MYIKLNVGYKTGGLKAKIILLAKGERLDQPGCIPKIPIECQVSNVLL